MRWSLYAVLASALLINLADGRLAFGQSREEAERQQQAERQRQQQEQQQAEQQRQESQRAAEAERQRQQQEQRQADQQRQENQRAVEAERRREQQEQQQAEQQRQESRRAAEAERQRQQQEQRQAEQQRQESQRAAEAERQRQQQEQQQAEQQRQESQRGAEAERQRQQQEQQQADQQRQQQQEQERQQEVLRRQEQLRQRERPVQPLPRPQPGPFRTPPAAAPGEIPAASPAAAPQPTRQNYPTTYPEKRVNPVPAGPSPTGTTPPPGRPIYAPRTAPSLPQPAGEPGPAVGRTVGGPARIPAGSGTAPRPTTRGPAYAPPAAGAVRATAPGDGLILNSGGSQAVLGQVNAARNGMRGANHRPLPPGQVTVRENGRLTLDARTGRYEVRADGTLASYHANGQVALFLRDGRVRSLRTPEFELHRSPGGGRTLVGRRPDQSILVATGRSGGYLERSISIGKRPFIQRTYARNGATQTRFFRPYRYRGLFLPVYVPPVYYPAAFYRWIFGPWRLRPIYAWPWLNQLWYRFHMGYFTPAPYYSGADFWLADYVESQTLEAGYEEEPPLADETGDSLSGAPETVWLPEDDQLCADEDTPIGEELRAAIAEEVRNLIAAEEALSGGGEDPSRMDPRAEWRPNRLFIVSRRLEVLAGRRTCELSPGAVLQLIASPEESTAAMLRVVASKRGDCPVGVEAAVSLQDLQEMRNDLRARLDAGLEALRNGQGQAGLPPAPPAALAPPQPGTPGAPAAEPGVPALLADQQRQADRAESEIVKAALPAPPGRQ